MLADCKRQRAHDLPFQTFVNLECRRAPSAGTFFVQYALMCDVIGPKESPKR